jgi:hypothetical protein
LKPKEICRLVFQLIISMHPISPSESAPSGQSDLHLPLTLPPYFSIILHRHFRPLPLLLTPDCMVQRRCPTHSSPIPPKGSRYSPPGRVLGSSTLAALRHMTACGLAASPPATRDWPSFPLGLIVLYLPNRLNPIQSFLLFPASPAEVFVVRAPGILCALRSRGRWMMS